jgi:hypothetical protein
MKLKVPLPDDWLAIVVHMQQVVEPKEETLVSLGFRGSMGKA